MIADAAQREATAYHEAGHGVLDVVTGQRFRYITLRPRDPGRTGHVMVDRTAQAGWWHNEAAAAFAGVIAEDMWWAALGPSTDTETRRRILTQEAGRADMLRARNVTRSAWERQVSWSVRQMAEAAWRHAVRTIATHGQAVAVLAELLLTQSGAVTWRQAREIAAGCEVAEVSAEHPSITGLLRP